MDKRWGMIATWSMADEGVEKGATILKDGGRCYEAIEIGIKDVEDNPEFTSVGYGGLPNEDCEVELDSAFMDGKTLSIGAVAGIKDFKNPISIARKLSEDRFNIFLVGEGAQSYAHKNGFERKNMLSQDSKKAWEIRKKEMNEKNLSPYDGHDTVCMIALDREKNMAVGTSTSGLFMKKRGRVGDSPLSGSGFYVDSEIGGAAATGLGEDIMKGCLSYEVVRRMKEGLSPQESAQSVVDDFSEELIKRRGQAGAISIVAMDNKGRWGIGTNVEFTFVVETSCDEHSVYIANYDRDKKEVKIEVLK